MIDFDRIVENVVSNIERTETSYMRRVAAKVLGVEIDHWGDVKSVSSDIHQYVKKDERVKAAIAEYQDKVVELATKPFSQKSVLEMANNIRRKIIADVEDKIYRELTDQIQDVVYKEVKERIKTDLKLAPYIIADKIKG